MSTVSPQIFILSKQTYTCSNPSIHTQTQFYWLWHTKTKAQGSMYTHTHTHANTPPHSPDTSADRLWGHLLSLLCHFSFGSGPSSVQHHDLPMWSRSPPAVNKATHSALCVPTGEHVTDKERERIGAFASVFSSNKLFFFRVSVGILISY